MIAAEKVRSVGFRPARRRLSMSCRATAHSPHLALASDDGSADGSRVSNARQGGRGIKGRVRSGRGGGGGLRRIFLNNNDLVLVHASCLINGERLDRCLDAPVGPRGTRLTTDSILPDAGVSP